MTKKRMGLGKPAPCYECAERAEGCHSVCGRYRAFQDERAALNRARQIESERRDAAWLSVMRLQKQKRKHGKL